MRKPKRIRFITGNLQLPEHFDLCPGKADPPFVCNEPMADTQIQFVPNENGQPTAVIVPIEMWREIEAERETNYLLKSEGMKKRLLASLASEENIPFEPALEKPGI